MNSISGLHMRIAEKLAVSREDFPALRIYSNVEDGLVKKYKYNSDVSQLSE